MSIRSLGNNAQLICIYLQVEYTNGYARHALQAVSLRTEGYPSGLLTFVDTDQVGNMGPTPPGDICNDQVCKLASGPNELR